MSLNRPVEVITQTPDFAAEFPAAQGAALAPARPQSADLLATMNPAALAEAKRRGFAIQINDIRAIAEIGAAPAASLTTTATRILEGVRVNAAGSIGDLLINWANSTQELNPQQLTVQSAGRKLRGLLEKAGLAKDIITQFLERYDTLSERISEIGRQLNAQKEQLITDATQMGELATQSEALSAELLLEAAGVRNRIDYERHQLAGLNHLADSGKPFDEEYRNLLTIIIPILEQKQADLLAQAFAAKLTAEQARVQLKANLELSAKVGSALTLTMTIWRTQIAVYVTTLRQQEAAKGVSAVRDVTGTMMQQTAQALHQGAVMAAQEANTPLITAETLVKVVEEYRATVEDVVAEYQKGRGIREAAAKTISEQVVQLEAAKANAATQITAAVSTGAPQLQQPR